MSGERWSNAPPSVLLDGLRPVLQCGRVRNGTDCAGRASPGRARAPGCHRVCAISISAPADACRKSDGETNRLLRCSMVCGPSCNADRFETARIARV
eukprot:3054375-Prymnesium_polylepis.1